MVLVESALACAGTKSGVSGVNAKWGDNVRRVKHKTLFAVFVESRGDYVLQPVSGEIGKCAAMRGYVPLVRWRVKPVLPDAGHEQDLVAISVCGESGVAAMETLSLALLMMLRQRAVGLAAKSGAGHAQALVSGALGECARVTIVPVLPERLKMSLVGGHARRERGSVEIRVLGGNGGCVKRGIVLSET